MSQNKINIFWFRQDLRLHDNPGFFESTQNTDVLPIYIHDNTKSEFPYKNIGGASKWWLHQSLKDLNINLNGTLNIFQGNPLDILKQLSKTYPINGIFWNRLYEPYHINRDQEIKTYFKNSDIDCKSYNGSLLWEPHTVFNKEHKPYRVFTSYYKNGCLNAPSPRIPLPAPHLKRLIKDSTLSITLDEIKLISTLPWYQSFESLWHVGEAGAKKSLHEFMKNSLSSYKTNRDIPSLINTSKLSPYLHFGEISPNQVWHAIQSYSISNQTSAEPFLRQLIWREFSYYLLYHFQTITTQNIQKKFDNFPWQNNNDILKSWQKGKTGYPIVDAGMRELWQTGNMHNRVRMIVASFLVKNLNIHWRHGADWFWDCLLDADLANNSASWQWVAGCGMDAAPYFRIFNPILQSEKFDPDGIYIKRYIPELANLPIKYLFTPWLAPKEVLAKADVILGKTYPLPIIDYVSSRDYALSSFKNISQYIIEK